MTNEKESSEIECRGQMILQNSGVRLNFMSIWLRECKHTYSFTQNLKFVFARTPLWYACYFLLLDAELSGLQHRYPLSSGCFFILSFSSERQIQCCSTEPTRAKTSKGEADEFIYFQRLFSPVQVNLAKTKNLLLLSRFRMAGSKR